MKRRLRPIWYAIPFRALAEFLGFAALTVAAWMVYDVAGIVVGGIALLIYGNDRSQ